MIKLWCYQPSASSVSAQQAVRMYRIMTRPGYTTAYYDSLHCNADGKRRSIVSSPNQCSVVAVTFPNHRIIMVTFYHQFSPIL